MTRFSSVLVLLPFALGAALFSVSTGARAADAEAKPATPVAAAPATPAASADAADDEPLTPEQAAEKAELDKAEAAAPKDNKDATLVADAEAGSSPVETPNVTYYGVGARYRAIIVPKFMMNLFGDGGRTVVAHGFGPEFTIRKNAFEYQLSAMYSSYAMDPTPFKASSDDRLAWEIVESRIKILYLTADFMWSHDFMPEFAFNYGVGAGVGIVWGDLFRNQATRNGQPNANDSTGEGYVKCAGPSTTDPFCGDDNDHYGSYSEKSWSSGGSKPIIFPWLALQTGFRYKPHRNVIARFDAGFGTSGFFLGLGVDYGL